MALSTNKNIRGEPVNGPGKRINFFYLIFLGFIVLAASAAVYLLILKDSFGSFPYSDLIPTKKAFENILKEKPNRIAFIDTEASPHDSGKSTDREISQWKNFFSIQGLKFDILNKKSFEERDIINYTLIVIPASDSFNRKKTEVLKEFVKNGGSIFAAGISSIDTGLIELFNLKFIPISPQEYRDPSLNKKISVLRGGTPFTSGIPAGSKIHMTDRGRKFKAELYGNNVFPLGFFNTIYDTAFTDLSAAYGYYQAGRFLWTDFIPDSVSEEDFPVFSKFILNSINWLLKKPSVYVNEFPGNYSSGLILAPIISDSINNIYNFLKILSDENIKGTFFIDHEKAVENLPLTGELVKFGEIGVFYYSKPGILNKNFSFFNLLRKESEQEVINNLKESKRRIEQITGSKCRGCIIFPEFAYQTSTEISEKAGYKYLISDSALPYSPLPGKKKSFLIFNASLIENLSDSGKFSENFCIDSVLFVHGLLVLKVKIEEFDQLKKINETYDLVRYLKKKNFWITTVSGFQKWREEKLNLSVSVVRRGEKKIYLRVLNNGNSCVEKFAVDVDLNEISGIRNIYLSPEFLPGKKVKVLNIDSQGIITLLFNNVKAGESLNYYIDYNTLDI